MSLVGELIDVERNQFEVRAGAAVVVVAFEDLADDHVGVRTEAVFGDEAATSLGWSTTDALQGGFATKTQRTQRRKAKKTKTNVQGVTFGTMVLCSLFLVSLW